MGKLKSIKFWVYAYLFHVCEIFHFCGGIICAATPLLDISSFPQIFIYFDENCLLCICKHRSLLTRLFPWNKSLEVRLLEC